MISLEGRRAAVLTVSDTVASGAGADTSGDLVAERLAALGAEIAARDVVRDDRRAIAERLRVYADELGVALVITTGGSGLAATDVTPEATLDVVERLVPGLPEAARQRTAATAPLAVLSRGVAGVRRRTLIVNLPGSPRAVREWLDVLLPVLPHALALVQGDPIPWGRDHRAGGP